MGDSSEKTSEVKGALPSAQDGGRDAGEKRGDVIDLQADSFTPEEEKRVLRKIDCTVLPMVRHSQDDD